MGDVAPQQVTAEARFQLAIHTTGAAGGEHVCLSGPTQGPELAVRCRQQVEMIGRCREPNGAERAFGNQLQVALGGIAIFEQDRDVFGPAGASAGSQRPEQL